MSVLIGIPRVQLRNESTRRYGLAAIAAAIVSVLVIGFSTGSANAAGQIAGPPAPASPSSESIRASKICGADGSACEAGAAQTDPVSEAPGKTPAPPAGGTTGVGGKVISGGAAPGNGNPETPGGTVDPAGDGPTEPAFVGQDPSLSDSGGASSLDATSATTSSPLGVVPLTIPNFLINKFEIPPFLLPIYQACGTEYGIPWEVLAAINRIETNFGELATATSTAGAVGWMQFMPATWEGYGVDANGDKVKDPTNPVDAICAAANYLKASGYADSPEGAIFAYNHADWYVDDVLTHARAYASIPPELISALTGLTEGARFPVAAEATYEGEISTDDKDARKVASHDVSSSEDRRSIAISAEGGSPVIAVNDGIISQIDTTTGTIQLTDAYGNRYTYSGLGSIARSHPVPRPSNNATEVSDDPGDVNVPVAVPDIPTPTGSAVIQEMADALLSRGYSVIATAGIIGNAYRESSWNPASVGTGGGGLFGFTAGAISLANLQAAATASGVEWTNVDFQVGFMDAHMDSDLKKRLNATTTISDSTQLFMDEWERPGIPAFEDRLAGANKAMEVLSAVNSGGASPNGPQGVPAGSEPQAQPEAQTPPAQPMSEVKVDPDAAAAADTPSDAGASDEKDPVSAAEDRRAEQAALVQGAKADGQMMNTEDMRGRVYANPLRPQNQSRSTVEGISTVVHTPAAGSLSGKAGDYVIYDGSKSGVYRFDPKTTDLKELKKGSRVIAGTVLGRMVESPGAAIDFSIQPGGKDAPEIDPKPFLDGWKLLAETNIYNSKGGNRLADNLGVGGILLLSKPALQRRVLSDPGLDIYECGRQDIASGFTDRRVLAMLAFLRAKGFTMTITSLTCGHGTYSSSGYVSEHTTGTAVDIAAFNGEVVSAATQGPGSLTDIAARDVMSLQGAMAPHQVISLTDYGNGIGFAMSDHDDHLHVGFRPVAGGDAPGAATSMATLGADQWQRLTERLGEIGNPDVLPGPSDSARPAGKGK